MMPKRHSDDNDSPRNKRPQDQLLGNNSKDNNQPKIPRASPIWHHLRFTLEEMYNGTVRRLRVEKNVKCDMCQGMGSCERMPYICCERCLGRKTVLDSTTVLLVRVKRGSRHGQRIIYKDEGNFEPEKRLGYVIVVLEEAVHPIFQRTGDDLTTTVTLDLVEALCGFEKIITTLDERQLCISSPRGEVIQNHSLKYIPGEGMPKLGTPTERGILIVHFEINLPSRVRSVFAPIIEDCLPPREDVDIPLFAEECNLVPLPIVDDDHYDYQYDYNNENGPEEEYQEYQGENLDFPSGEHYYQNEPLEHHEEYFTQSGSNEQYHYYHNQN